MKICIFTKTLLKGGAEKQSVLLSTVLQKKFDVYLVVLFNKKNDQYYKTLQENKTNVIFLKDSIFGKIFQLKKFLKKEKIEILFCYLASTNLIGVIAGKLAKTRFIIGGIRNTHHTKTKETVLKLLHNNFLDYTITNSYSSVKVLAKKRFNSDKIVVIPNGIEPNNKFYTKELNDSVHILTVARFVPQKDYLTAINTINYLYFHLLKQKHREIKYTIVGYGEEKLKIENYIKERNLKNIIEIKDDKDLENTFQKADIYFSTSLYEGVSNSILEAMNYSLPIVATDVGDNSRLVHNTENGFICKAKDYKTLANALHILILNPSSRILMGRNSRKILEDDFSVKTFERRYINFISQISTHKLKVSEENIEYKMN